jgi:sugar phosphate isomerase/epimerase
MQRRSFLATSLVLPTAISAARDKPLSQSTAGPFSISLKADAIGVGASSWETLNYAIDHGYNALSVSVQWLESWTAADKKRFVGRATKNGVRWGASGLPVEFRKSESRFRSDLSKLAGHAKSLREIGVDRIGTWILPMHAELSYNQNMEQHSRRLRDTARVLGQEGIKLGLEYIGTTNLRHSKRFAFISSGRETKELIKAIGEPNVGVILDSYHWHTAQESAEDLTIWSNEEIIAVDLNDCNAKLALEDQTDTARELPGATGVIDLNSFLQTLNKVGFDGPLRAEPFSATLNQMEDEMAVAATIAAIKGAIAKAGR